MEFWHFKGCVRDCTQRFPGHMLSAAIVELYLLSFKRGRGLCGNFDHVGM